MKTKLYQLTGTDMASLARNAEYKLIHFNFANKKRTHGTVVGLNKAHYAAERKHCLTTGNHYTKKVRRGNYTACFYCGGTK